MPPTIGAAIGFITSEPTPDSHKIGIRLTTYGFLGFRVQKFWWGSSAGRG
jgi:hypothetical protein